MGSLQLLQALLAMGWMWTRAPSRARSILCLPQRMRDVNRDHWRPRRPLGHVEMSYRVRFDLSTQRPRIGELSRRHVTERKEERRRHNR